MFTELNDRLEEVKERQRKKNKLEARLHKLRDFTQVEEQKVNELLQIVQKEEQDVQKLEGLSVTNLFYTFLGRKLEKLDQEKQEALAAKLKYDEAVDTLQDLKNEIVELEIEWQDVHTADQEYQTVLQEKERLIYDQSSVWSEEIYQLSEQIAELKADLKEYKEAIQAGDNALSALQQAVEALEKAKGWATWDMFGGGMISTAIKHSYINDARSFIHRAQTKLRHFEEELADIQQRQHIHIESGSFLTFADYFFDGFIVDWIVHGKITDSLEQTYQTRRQVSSLVTRLQEEFSKLEHNMQQLQSTRIRKIEEAK